MSAKAARPRAAGGPGAAGWGGKNMDNRMDRGTAKQ